MDNALLLYLKKLEAKIDGLDVDIEDLNELALTIKTTVDDVLNGTQLSDWISDLETSGKSSATYNDASRMNTLIANEGACKNTKINQHLFDWSVINNRVGTFYNSGLGAVSGVTWSSILTPAQVSSNSSAFRAVAKNADMFTVFLNNATAKATLWTNSSVTESILASGTANSVLKQYATRKTHGSLDNVVPGNVRWFLFETNDNVWWHHLDLALKNGGEIERLGDTSSKQDIYRVNKFVTQISTSEYGDKSLWSFTYIEF